LQIFEVFAPTFREKTEILAIMTTGRGHERENAT